MFKDSDCKSDNRPGWVEGVLGEGCRMDCSLEPREGVSSVWWLCLMDRLMAGVALSMCMCVGSKVACVLILGRLGETICVEIGRLFF